MGKATAGIVPQNLGRVCERVDDPIYDHERYRRGAGEAWERELGQSLAVVRESAERMAWFTAGLLWLARERCGPTADFELLCREQHIGLSAANAMVAVIERYLPAWCRVQREFLARPEIRPQERRTMLLTARQHDGRIAGRSFDAHVRCVERGGEDCLEQHG